MEMKLENIDQIAVNYFRHLFATNPLSLELESIFASATLHRLTLEQQECMESPFKEEEVYLARK